MRVELKSGKNPFDVNKDKVKKTGLVTRRKRIDDFRKKMKEKKTLKTNP